MSHNTRASEHAATSPKGKGKAVHARLVRFQVDIDDNQTRNTDSYDLPGASEFALDQPIDSDHEAAFESLPDLVARVAHLRAQVNHLSRAQTTTKVLPPQDLRSAKDALRSALQGVQGVEEEVTARMKGNDARISRMEKKLLAMKQRR